MKQRVCRVTGQYLVEALNLPHGTTIHDLRFNWHLNEFDLRVEHPSFDEVPPGGQIPRCTVLLYTSTHVCPTDGSTWHYYQSVWSQPTFC